MAKATQVEMEKRIIEVAEMLSSGRTRSYIIEYARDNWGIARATSDVLIRKASDRLAEVNADKIEETQAKIVSALWRQYRRADDQKNAMSAMLILKEIAKLKGLDESTVHLKIDRPAKDLSDAELEEAFKKTF